MCDLTTTYSYDILFHNMTLNYKEVGKGRDPSWAVGIRIMDDTAQSLHRQGLLPSKFPQPNEALEELFQRLVSEYKKNPNDPDVNTQLWREFLQETDIPACDWTEEQIAAPIMGVEGEPQQGMMVYLPEDYRGREGLVRLGQRFPQMDNWSVLEESTIVSDNRPGGWIKIEASVHAQNENTPEQQLKNHFESQGRFGQREEVYILGGQFSKRVSGRYFDQGGTWSRLLGSRHEGEVVLVSFDPDGALLVYSTMDPKDSAFLMGGRSEGVL